MRNVALVAFAVFSAVPALAQVDLTGTWARSGQSDNGAAREIREILASQRKMLARRNETARIDDAEMEAEFRRHLSVIKPWLVRQPNIEVFYVNYNALMSNPEPLCRRVLEFTNVPLDLNRMLKVPNGELYRNRA